MPSSVVNLGSVLWTSELLHGRRETTYMSLLGKLDKLLPTNGNWTQYIEKMDQFFIANNIREKPRKRVILLRSCGAITYRLLHNLVEPAKPLDKNCCELIVGMKEHQNPKPAVIVERYIFNKRNRKPSESIPFYLTETFVCL